MGLFYRHSFLKEYSWKFLIILICILRLFHGPSQISKTMKNCRHGRSKSHGRHHSDSRLCSFLWENPGRYFLSHPQSRMTGMASSPGREPSRCLHSTFPAGVPSAAPFPGATRGPGAQLLPRGTGCQRQVAPRLRAPHGL